MKIAFTGRPSRRAARAVELALVFVGIPVALRAGLIPAERMLVLGAVTAVGLLLLLLDRTFDRRRLWRAAGLRSALGGILLRAGAAALVISAAVLWIAPDRLLSLPSHAPCFLLARLAFYALVSAWPQEVLYRVLFFHRYAVLFPTPRALVVASGLAFALLHVVFANAIAPILTLPAGLALARTYRRTGSMGPVWLEHTLYGALVFLLGLAPQFGGGRLWPLPPGP